MTTLPPSLQSLFALSPMTLADLPAYVDMLGDPRVHQYLFFAPASEAEIREYLEPQLQAQTNGESKGQILAVRDPQGRFEGMVALIESEQPGTFELGFQLHPSTWGQGVATAAARLMLGTAFDKLGAEQVSADCYQTNAASQRVLAKAGLWITGIKKGVFEQGTVNQCCYGLTRSEYQRSRAVAAITAGAELDAVLSTN